MAAINFLAFSSSCVILLYLRLWTWQVFRVRFYKKYSFIITDAYVEICKTWWLSTDDLHFLCKTRVCHRSLAPHLLYLLKSCCQFHTVGVFLLGEGGGYIVVRNIPSSLRRYTLWCNILFVCAFLVFIALGFRDNKMRYSEIAVKGSVFPLLYPLIWNTHSFSQNNNIIKISISQLTFQYNEQFQFLSNYNQPLMGESVLSRKYYVLLFLNGL